MNTVKRTRVMTRVIETSTNLKRIGKKIIQPQQCNLNTLVGDSDLAL